MVDEKEAKNGCLRLTTGWSQSLKYGRIMIINHGQLEVPQAWIFSTVRSNTAKDDYLLNVYRYFLGERPSDFAPLRACSCNQFFVSLKPVALLLLLAPVTTIISLYLVFDNLCKEEGRTEEMRLWNEQVSMGLEEESWHIILKRSGRFLEEMSMSLCMNKRKRHDSFWLKHYYKECCKG